MTKSALMKALESCPNDCCIEHIDYYRCTKCHKDFIVRSGDDDVDSTTRDVIVRAAFGWLPEPAS